MSVEARVVITRASDYRDYWQAAREGLSETTIAAAVAHALKHGVSSTFFGEVPQEEVSLLSTNYRESLRVHGLNSHQRAILEVVQEEAALASPDARVAAPEAPSGLAEHLVRRYPHLVDTEFGRSSGVLALRYAKGSPESMGAIVQSGSLNAVFTWDVLQRVGNIQSALLEMHRVLRPGGVSLSTFPFTWREASDYGDVGHLHSVGGLERVNHSPSSGDERKPVIPGWEIMQWASEAGFTEVEMILLASSSAAIFGSRPPFVNVLRCRKTSPPVEIASNRRESLVIRAEPAESIEYRSSDASHHIRPEALFRRGFLIRKGIDGPLPFGWRRLVVDDGRGEALHIGLHPETECEIGHAGADSLILLGTAIDVAEGDGSASPLANALLRSYQEDPEAFFTDLSQVAGRWACLVVSGGHSFVLNDALGMRCVFYRKDVRGRHSSRPLPVTVASHAALLGQDFVHNLYVDKFKYGYPGVRTPYLGVRMLTPNTLLDLHSGEVSRYWPRLIRAATPLGNLDKLAITTVQVQAATLLQRFGTITVSLTAGLDSRLTLALLRPFWDRLRIFTYSHDGLGKQATGEQVDAAVAAEICSRLGLKHLVIDRMRSRDERRFAEFQSVAARNTHERSSDGLHYSLMEEFERESTVYFRSIGGEVGRPFLRNWSGDKERQVTARRLAEMYSLWLPKEADAAEYVERAEPLFAEYMHLTDFGGIQDWDPYVVAYWELRNATGLALVNLEADAAFETIVPLNTRAVLQSLAATEDDGLTYTSMVHELVDSMVPEITDIPVNPKSYGAGQRPKT